MLECLNKSPLHHGKLWMLLELRTAKIMSLTIFINKTKLLHLQLSLMRNVSEVVIVVILNDFSAGVVKYQRQL